MARPPLERNGTPLVVKQAEVEFSYFPTVQTKRRDRLQSKVFTTDAWSIIHATTHRVSNATLKRSAIAFAEQAQEFYLAASSAATTRAKPLLLYYCFLNLAKSLALVQNNAKVIGNAKHGLSDPANVGTPIESAVLTAFASSSSSVNMFDEFRVAIGEPKLLSNAQYKVNDLMASSLVGHRLWCSANERHDRFYRVDPEIRHDSGTKSIWLRAWMPSAGPKHAGISFSEIERVGFQQQWKKVRPKCPGSHGDYELFEQASPTQYSSRPSDSLGILSQHARSMLHRAMRVSEPFRVYYIYVPSAGFAKHHQMESRYSLLYFLGSVTRYHPADFDAYMSSKYGPFLSEFLASEPGQLLFEMASLFAEREIVSVGLA